MKHYITPEQIATLTPEAQEVLTGWFLNTIEWDDDLVRVYIPEERTADTGGVFQGYWDRECEFSYPEHYTGKLKNHEGTILLLLSIGQPIAFLDERIQEQQLYGYWQMYRYGSDSAWRVIRGATAAGGEKYPELCDALWAAVVAALEVK